MREQTALAIIKVNEAIAAADNLQTLSDTLFKTLASCLKLKWLALYNVFPRDTQLNATFSGEPPLTFAQSSAELENQLHDSLASVPGTCTVFRNCKQGSDAGANDFTLMLTLSSSPLSHRLALSLDWRQHESAPDAPTAELLHGIRALVSACAQTILERRQADLRAALNPDELLRTYILIDTQGTLTDFPPASMTLLRNVYLDQELNQLPLEIASWAKQAMEQLHNKQTSGYAETLLIYRRIGLRLKTVILGGQPFGLLLLIDKRSPDDFSPLEACGLTAREIEVLNCLPTGYSNAQIAMALGIQEITVKKHLKAIGDKLGAAGKTEILYTALAKLLDLSGRTLTGL